MTTNSRAEALRNAFGPSRSSFDRPQQYQQYQQNHRRDRPYSYGSRIPKETPKPLSTRQMELPTHSTSRNTDCSPPPINPRLDFLKKEKKPLRWDDGTPLCIRKKKSFVAMPSKTQWEKGFRPAWMLIEQQDPPEKYEDGFWIYQNYLKTGEVVLIKRKSVGDKTKATATNYMNTRSNSKKMKRSK